MNRHFTVPHPLDHKEPEKYVRDSEWGEEGVTREYVHLPQVCQSHLGIEGETSFNFVKGVVVLLPVRRCVN